MARNRKHQTAAIRFAPALRAFLLCMVIGGAGIGYVWQKHQVVKLGNQIRKSEKQLGALNKEHEGLKNQLTMMQTVGWIEARVKALNLGLGPVGPNQVLVLPEPVPESVAPRGVTQYAAGRNTAQPIP